MQVDGADDPPEEGEEEEVETEQPNEVQSDYSTDSSEINSSSKIDTDNSLRFLLTNARSLKTKINSLVDAFDSLKLHAAGITETWFKGGRELAASLEDVEGAHGIRVLHKSRDGRKRGPVGGGVALAFNTATCNMKIRKLKPEAARHEILCTVGKVGKLTRTAVIFVVYIPPRTRVDVHESITSALADEIARVRADLKDPLIMVGGDFNHRDVSDGLVDTCPFTLLETGPTRGPNRLDLLYTNFHQNVAEAEVLPPLQSQAGIDSDHKCIQMVAEFPPSRGYEWEVKWRRKRSRKADSAFADDLGAWDWSQLDRAVGVDAKVEVFEQAVQILTDKHYPWSRVRKRSNEDPWITPSIRRLWKKKMRLYKRKGKGAGWFLADKSLQEEIEAAKGSYVERLLEQGGNGRSFFAATRNLTRPSSSPQWQVSDLFEDKSPESVAKEVLDYFGNISGGEAAPLPDVHRVPGVLGEFTEARVIELLKKSKKTESMVMGDPFPHLIRDYASKFAKPVAMIYNEVNTSSEWPSNWKREFLTIIPKVPNPSNLSECRNISCTALLSKILENQLLLKLRQELQPDSSQYGGIPGCGVDHLLVDLWEKILACMQGGKRAAVLLGVDFEKAFNRMEHGVCLDQLRILGASPGSVGLVAAFLEGRVMTINVDGHTAAPVGIVRGSPQGSVLGCLLYCVTTQRLTKDLTGGRVQPALVDRQVAPRRPVSPDGVRPAAIPEDGEPVRYFPQLSDTEDEEGINFWDPIDPEILEELGDGRGIESFKYIDDTTLFEAAEMEAAIRHVTTATTTEELQGLAVSQAVKNLDARATAINMKINKKKTQLLVISPPNGCTTGAVVDAGGGEMIEDVAHLKLVGFHFGRDPGVGTHVMETRKKFRRRIWMLYHLRKAGLRDMVLFRLYACYIRSIIEYCSPVYHSLLNAGQAQALEKLHRQAVRVCFGFERPVEEIMAENCIETLEQRRLRRCDAFIRKAAKNPRFRERWLQRRPSDTHNLRNRRNIVEERADSVRRFNSPLFFIRRRANQLGID